MKHTRAFTLPELLVVITVIGVLAALLLPVLGTAKAKTKSIACISNLRQVGLGLQLYADENKQRLPSVEPTPTMPVDPANPLPRIYVVLAPHVGYPTNSPKPARASIFHCPSDFADRYKREWSSYEWAYPFNGASLMDLRMGPFQVSLSEATLMFDYENFHTERTARSPKNALYADGHAAALIPPAVPAPEPRPPQ